MPLGLRLLGWVVPYDQMRGDKLPPATRKEILEEGISMMTKTVVPTP